MSVARAVSRSPVRAVARAGGDRSARVGGAAPGQMTLFLDTFTGAASSYGFVGHTPDVGDPWTYTDLPFLKTDGNGYAWAEFGVPNAAIVDPGVPRYVLSLVFVNETTLSGGRVVFGWIDADNHYQINIDSAGSQLTLYKHLLGDVTPLASVAGLSPTIPAGSTLEVTRRAGGQIDVRVIGVTGAALSATDSSFESERSCGLQSQPSDGRYDDFTIKTL